MKVGVTGHQRLSDPNQWALVELAVSNFLDSCSRPLQGVSCLAIGADQLFARLVLAKGGTLEVVLPFPNYERTFSTAGEREAYRHYCKQAHRVEVSDWKGSDEQSYLAAGQRVVDLSDLLIAIWDGEPAGGLGGTADIVAYAREHGRAVEHINPILFRRIQ